MRACYFPCLEYRKAHGERGRCAKVLGQGAGSDYQNSYDSRRNDTMELPIVKPRVEEYFFESRKQLEVRGR